MARKSKKNTNPTPLTVLLWTLAVIGKPIYFLFSKIVIFFIFIISVSIQSIPRIKLEFLRLNLFEIRLTKTLFKKRKIKYKIKKRYILLFTLSLLTITFYLLVLKDLPSLKDLKNYNPDVSTKIYDRNGILLYKIYKDENRTLINLKDIPIYVRLATLAAEDAEFYNHSGFSIKGIIRSLFENIGSKELKGGSTITQQLIKNTLLSPEKTISRKIKEIILAVELENNYTKDAILEMYLNEVAYGGTAYGIAEASNLYFGKSIENVNLAEAALLAGLPKSPTNYSPTGGGVEIAIQRQKDVLKLMRINKFITEDEEKEARETPITFISKRIDIKAPHFVMYIKKILSEKYGEDILQKGGLEITTSLDSSIQELSEKIVKQEIEKLNNLNVKNGSALVINPKTGEILAMVGSKDYFDEKIDGNVNVLERLRQPGSSIKLVNYAYALSHDYNPASILDDSPITYNISGSKPYSPKNYDGKFVGKLSLRNAFAQSRNIPAVKVLASYGVQKMVEQGQKMGITTWNDPKNYGLSLTLGGGAVKATDLAKVYATVANYGKTPELIPILQVKNYKGKLLEKNNPKSNQTLDPRIAFQIIDILNDNNARAPEFGYNSSLVIKNHPEVAVKTGTSNELRDNWTVGFNQNYLVLTWVGNNDNSEMSHIASGITGAAPIWNKIISTLLSDKKSYEWQIPQGLIKVMCNGKPEYFKYDNIPTSFCKPTPTPDTTNNTEGQKAPQIL